jgi:hypothetical protein
MVDLTRHPRRTRVPQGCLSSATSIHVSTHLCRLTAHLSHALVAVIASMSAIGGVAILAFVVYLAVRLRVVAWVLRVRVPFLRPLTAIASRLSAVDPRQPAPPFVWSTVPPAPTPAARNAQFDIDDDDDDNDVHGDDARVALLPSGAAWAASSEPRHAAVHPPAPQPQQAFILRQIVDPDAEVALHVAIPRFPLDPPRAVGSAAVAPSPLEHVAVHGGDEAE